MWIHSKDTIQYQNKTLTVVSVDGIYSVASNVSISLKDESGNTITMNYMNDFYQKVKSGEIKVTHNTKRNSRGY